MDSVSNILGIDRVNMNGKLIVVEEKHESNANFIINSIIFNALKKETGILLVLFHNTFNHYHNVAMKFGYNLTMLKEKNKVNIVEPMKIIASDIERIGEESTHDSDVNFSKFMANSNVNAMKNLLTTIKDEYHKMKNSNEDVIIIIEDLSHIYNLGFSSESPVYYVRYLRSLLQCNNVSQLCILIHTYKHLLQDCISDVLSHYLKHIAHLHIVVDLLESGYTSEISGKITVNWKIDSIRKKYNFSEVARYIYTVSDRQVKISIPDTTVTLT